MLHLKNPNGDETAIRAFDISVTDTIGALSTLTFNFIDDSLNHVGALMMIPRTIVTEPKTGKMFRIATSNPQPYTKAKLYAVQANHVGGDLHDKYEETQLTKTQSLQKCMDVVVKGTSFKYVIHGSFSNYSFSESFGTGFGDDLLQQLASDFKFEYYFDNYTIHIFKSIGKAGAFLFVDGSNVAKITQAEDYSVIRTHIQGYAGKPDEKTGKYPISAEYTSPLAKDAKWGLIDDEVYSNENMTKQGLQAKLKEQLHDYPDVQYTLDSANFNKNLQGFKNDTTVGNSGYLRDRFGIDVEVRLQGKTYYPQENKLGQVTLGNSNFDPVELANQRNRAFEANEKLGKTLKKDVNTASEKATQAYTKRLAGEFVPDITRTIQAPTYQLYTPDKNDGFEGLEAGGKFYPYVPASTVGGLNETIQTIVKDAIKNIPEPEIKSILYGKTMNIIGDSYVANNGQPVADTWHYKIANNNKMAYRNYGVNGNCLVADGGSGTKVIDRLDEMDNEADYILVVGGKNDYNQQMAISEFSTQLASLIKKVVQKYQGKNVCFFTPWPDQGPAMVNPIALHEYADAIEEQCGLLGVPCFNSSKHSGIATYNAQFRAKYFQTADDVSHLNAAGHNLFINKAQRFLESL